MVWAKREKWAILPVMMSERRGLPMEEFGSGDLFGTSQVNYIKPVLYITFSTVFMIAYFANIL